MIFISQSADPDARMPLDEVPTDLEGGSRSVENVAVEYESHGVAGHGGSYRRLKVKCPHHRNCMKTRVFSDQFGTDSGYFPASSSQSCCHYMVDIYNHTTDCTSDHTHF